MDAHRFDALSRALTELGTRRNLLGLLATLPVLGGLMAMLATGDLAAKDRRRKQRHKRRKSPGKGKSKGKKGCKPKSRTTVCAGKCGPVKSRQTCGKTVDCGSCDCNPPCDACFTCQGAAGAPGSCVPQKSGSPCGEAATCADGVRQPQGSCDGSGACQPADPVSCAPYIQCAGNACATSCADDLDCVDGSFCAGGQCTGDGEDGADCGHGGQCASGHCVEHVCCDTACAGECVACNVAGSKGACTPLAAATPCGDATTCEEGAVYPQGTCDGSGHCDVADPVSCAPYARCAGDACATSCAGDGGCVAGYFCDTDQGTCAPERANGVGCKTGNQCDSGHCVDDVCCDTACAGACRACNLGDSVGTCTAEANGTTCGSGTICCSGTCLECCTSNQCDDPSKPICVGGACTACSGVNLCDAGQVCCGGSCVTGICCADADCAPGGNDCANHQCQCGGGATCSGGAPDCCGNPGSCTTTERDPANCGSCGNVCSGSTPVCWNGDCVCGDVCASGCRFSTVQAAINGLPAGSTIRVCAGTYAPITINKNLTLIGVGDGANSVSNTILDAGGSGRVVTVNSGVTASLQGLRITGGNSIFSGAGVFNNGTLAMTDCTVIDNATPDIVQGAGIFNGWNLTMTNCTISQNFAVNYGGGIATIGNLALVNCTLSRNSSGNGGNALWCASGTTTLTGCTVGPANSVGWFGTIQVLPNAIVTLDDTRVMGNYATEGGGIYNLGTTTLENGSAVSGNSAARGGGIYSTSGSVTLEGGSTVSSNSPDNCVGVITGPGCAP